MKLFKNILAVVAMAVTLSLVACGSDSDGDDDDGPDSIDRSDIVGTWNCEDTGMDIDRLIFYNDGTGLVEYGSRNNTSKYDFNWRLSSGRLYIDGEDVSLIQRGRRLSLTYLGDTYTWASSSTSGGGTTGGTTDKDDPKPDPEPDYKSILLNGRNWTCYNGGYNSVIFTFYNNNNIQFVNSGKYRVGSYGVPTLDARGTFYVSGSSLTATYTSIMTDPSGIKVNDHFPGWSSYIGSSRTITYRIISVDNNTLKLSDGQNTWTLNKL